MIHAPADILIYVVLAMVTPAGPEFMMGVFVAYRYRTGRLSVTMCDACQLLTKWFCDTFTGAAHCDRSSPLWLFYMEDI
jgi:hypothetical protein